MYESSFTEKFNQLNLTRIIQQVFDLSTDDWFEEAEENLTKKDVVSLERFLNVLSDIYKRLETVSADNTSLRTLEHLQNNLLNTAKLFEDTIELFKKQEKAPTFIEALNNQTDNYLQLAPSININFFKVDNNESIALFEESKVFLRNIKEFDISARSTQNEINSYLTEIKKYVVEGKQLVQLGAERTLSNSFAIRADKERDAAFRWTILTAFFALSTVAALIYVFFRQVDAAVNNEINYSLLSTKILTTATLGLIAKWTSKRANRHLIEESKYHRLAVNMATMNSFIAPLEQSEKNKVISDVATKIFTDGTGSETATDFETAGALDLIKNLLPKADK